MIASRITFAAPVFAALVFAALALGGHGARAEADFPRLAGLVIVERGEHIALLDTGDGTLTQVTVGDDVAGFRVCSIERDGVRLERGQAGALLHISPAAAPHQPVDSGGVTFGLVIRAQPPVDD